MAAPREPAIAAEPPVRAIRTLVLTDIVDSTALVERVGDLEAAAIFARIDRRTRDLLQDHGGREIDRTDGFLMLFELPLDALGFTLDVHQALEELSMETEQVLRVRAGLHTGEVVLRENTAEDIERGAKPLEVEGLAKPFAARIMSAAHGGQTLLSRGAYDLARRAAVGHPDFDAVSWASHGAWTLKGVAEPVELLEASRGACRRPPVSEKVKPVRSWWRRWLPRVAAAALAVLAGMAGGVWWWLNPAMDHNAPVFTVEGAPTLYEDVVRQSQLERAWDAYLEQDLSRVGSELGPLLEGEAVPPEVLLLLLISQSQHEVVGDHDDLVDLIARVDRSNSRGTGASLCVDFFVEVVPYILQDVSARPAWTPAVAARTMSALPAWIERHPDDVLAVLCASALRRGPEVDLPLIERLDPTGYTPAVVTAQVDAAVQLGDYDRAWQALERGKEGRPGSVALALAEGTLLWEQGELTRAMQVMEGALGEHPQQSGLRIAVAHLALLTQDEATFQRQMVILLQDGWLPDVRFALLEALHKPLLRAGRPQLARRLLESDPTNLTAWQRGLAFYVALPQYFSDDELRAHQDLLLAALSEPGRVSNPLIRERARTAHAHLDALLLLRQGKPIPAALRSQGEAIGPSVKLADLVAAYAGNLSFFEEDLETAVPAEGPCDKLVRMGGFAAVSGDPDRAQRLYRDALDEEACVGKPQHQAALAIAAGELALDALERDDLDAAAPYVAQYHELWPTAEPGLELARRLAGYGVLTGPKRLSEEEARSANELD